MGGNNKGIITSRAGWFGCRSSARRGVRPTARDVYRSCRVSASPVPGRSEHMGIGAHVAAAWGWSSFVGFPAKRFGAWIRCGRTSLSICRADSNNSNCQSPDRQVDLLPHCPLILSYCAFRRARANNNQSSMANYATWTRQSNRYICEQRRPRVSFLTVPIPR